MLRSVRSTRLEAWQTITLRDAALKVGYSRICGFADLGNTEISWLLDVRAVHMVDKSQYSARRAAFRKLHESGCFMLPNPYDVGTAVYLKHVGFKALASTSSGFAFSRGLPEHAVTRVMVIENLRELVAVADLPDNEDYYNCSTIDL